MARRYQVLNCGTWLAFLVEVVVMLAIVPDRRRRVHEHPIEIVVTALTPSVPPAGFAAARIPGLLRVLRLRLAPLARRLFTLDGIRYAALLALVTVVAGGSAVAAAEKQPDEWDGIGWAATTITTVGYGDLYPHTGLGRAIALMLLREVRDLSARLRRIERALEQRAS